MLSIFAFGHYKDFLRAHCDASRGALTKLAEAAGCQRSYLSKVLTADPHLTPDQGFLISRFLEFKSDEAEYFMLLLHDQDQRGYQTHLL
jgi:hypothetical protein